MTYNPRDPFANYGAALREDTRSYDPRDPFAGYGEVVREDSTVSHKKKRNYTLGETAISAAKNLPGDIPVLMMEGLESLANIGKFTASSALKPLGIEINDPISSTVRQIPNALKSLPGLIGQAVTDPRAVYEGGKRYVAEKPAHALADLSTVIALGGLGAGAAGATKTANVLNKVATATNPILGPATLVSKVTPNSLKRLPEKAGSLKNTMVDSVIDVVDELRNPKEALLMKVSEGEPSKLIAELDKQPKRSINELSDATKKRFGETKKALREDPASLSSKLVSKDMEQIKKSKLTAPEAASGAGLTQFNEFGQQASKLPAMKSKYRQLEMENNRKKIDTLKSIGKTPEELDNLVSEISKDIEKKYGVAFAKDAKIKKKIEQGDKDPFKGTDLDKAFEQIWKPEQIRAADKFADSDLEKAFESILKPVVKDGPHYKYTKSFRNLLSRPDFKKAMILAERAAKNGGRSIFRGAKDSRLTGQGVHDVKLAMDYLIAKTRNEVPFDSLVVRELTNAKKAYLDWVKKEIPEYDAARVEYSKRMVDVDKRKVAQGLQSTLEDIKGVDNAPLRAAMFLKAKKDSLETIKKFTSDQTRYKKLEDLFSPREMAKINNIEKELLQEAFISAQNKAGISGGGRLADIEQVSTPVRFPNPLSAKVTLTNQLLRFLTEKMNPKLAKEMSELLMSSSQTKEALKKARDWSLNVKRKELDRSIKRHDRKQTSKKIGEFGKEALKYPASFQFMQDDDRSNRLSEYTR